MSGSCKTCGYAYGEDAQSNEHNACSGDCVRKYENAEWLRAELKAANERADRADALVAEFERYRDQDNEMGLAWTEERGCGDNSCSFRTKRGGMSTNGGCRCHENPSVANRVFRLLRQRAERAEKERDEWKTYAKRCESEMLEAAKVEVEAKAQSAVLRAALEAFTSIPGEGQLELFWRAKITAARAALASNAGEGLLTWARRCVAWFEDYGPGAGSEAHSILCDEPDCVRGGK